MPSIKSDSENKSYPNKVQRESNNIVEDNPIIMVDSPQFEYTISLKQTSGISKAANITSDMKQQYKQNIMPIPNQNTTDNNGNIINIQLNYNIN